MQVFHSRCSIDQEGGKPGEVRLEKGAEATLYKGTWESAKGLKEVEW